MDIISQLPDDLLLRILSLATTKDVIATSLLSKRWRCLWTLVPQLEYNDSNHNGDYKSFSHFVYRSLLSNKAPVLEKFCLTLGAEWPFVDIGLWIKTAVSHRVRELKIHIRDSKEGSVSLPSSLYTSETLEILTLINCVVLNVPDYVCLPSLKSLNLELVDYKDNATLPLLFSGCPKLEELYVERHVRDRTTDVTVVVSSLQRLTMLDFNSGTCGRYVIDVPSLKYLKITDNVVFNFRQMENMPELAEAHVDITQNVTHEFLRALTSVRSLSLCLPLSKVMHSSGMIFNQLVHLDLYTITDDWWDLLIHMLQCSPKLQTLKLIDKHNSGFSGDETPIGWKRPSSIPECLQHSLKYFEWIGYKGRRGDIEMSNYVIDNAACLKKVTFSRESTDVREQGYGWWQTGICRYSVNFVSASIRLNNHNRFVFLVSFLITVFSFWFVWSSYLIWSECYKS